MFEEITRTILLSDSKKSYWHNGNQTLHCAWFILSCENDRQAQSKTHFLIHWGWWYALNAMPPNNMDLSKSTPTWSQNGPNGFPSCKKDHDKKLKQTIFPKDMAVCHSATRRGSFKVHYKSSLTHQLSIIQPFVRVSPSWGRISCLNSFVQPFQSSRRFSGPVASVEELNAAWKPLDWPHGGMQRGLPAGRTGCRVHGPSRTTQTHVVWGTERNRLMLFDE